MTFRITGIDPAPFCHLFGLDDGALAKAGAQRCVVDRPGAFPDRIGMRDLSVGETALLLNFEHQPNGVHYRSSHAIFVAEGAREPYDTVDEVPAVMRSRILSLRGFDDRHAMVEADICEGSDAENLIGRMLSNPGVAYIHAHYARRGCYAGLVRRGPTPA